MASTTPMYVGKHLGAIQVGSTIALFLFGFVTVQAYSYYKNFKNDPLSLKLFVLTLWSLEFIHQICLSHAAYVMIISQAGHFNPANIVLPRTTNVILFLSVIVSTMVQVSCTSSRLATATFPTSPQVFFLLRLWKVTQRRVMPAIISVVILARICLATTVGVKSVIVPTMNQLVDGSRWLLVSVWITGAVCDNLMTIALCYDLWTRKNHAFNQTSLLIERVIFLCIGTELITSLISASMIICFLLFDHSSIWIALYHSACGFYAISALFSLNIRLRLRRLREEPQKPIPSRPSLSFPSNVNPENSFNSQTSSAYLLTPPKRSFV